MTMNGLSGGGKLKKMIFEKYPKQNRYEKNGAVAWLENLENWNKEQRDKDLSIYIVKICLIGKNLCTAIGDWGVLGIDWGASILWKDRNFSFIAKWQQTRIYLMTDLKKKGEEFFIYVREKIKEDIKKYQIINMGKVSLSFDCLPHPLQMEL